MTATITEATRALVASSSYGYLSNTFGAAAIVLLLFLLAQIEIVRASGSGRAKTWLATLNIATLPLLLAFGVIVLARFLMLLFPGLR